MEGVEADCFSSLYIHNHLHMGSQVNRTEQLVKSVNISQIKYNTTRVVISERLSLVKSYTSLQKC